MTIRIDKHARLNPQPGDGYRLLVTRYWPRGLRRENINLWYKELAPSEKLLSQYATYFKADHSEEDHITYHEVWSMLYRTEMNNQHELINQLAKRHLKGDTLTLLCACHSTDRCHRTILAELIEEAAMAISDHE
ncbi:MAG: DUF488 family protein [Emcibacteraceae bacterium]